jgi:hypothetical protein
MDENEVIERKNDGKALFVLSIICLVVTYLAIGVFTYLMVSAYAASEANDQFGTAILLIFFLIYALAPSYLVSILSLIFSSIAFKKNKSAISRKITLVLSIIAFVALIGLTIFLFLSK